ncbi:MAG: kynureninase [Gemmatimonadetes bacterium]|nr:kynureninase [Gemmatimonadota bacterium]
MALHYGRFRVGERLLLTGHSHQAWPDVAFAAQQEAWLDAADQVDLKWERAFARAERVREGWRRLLGDPGADIALGQSTHELLVRLLSALPLRERPRVVTTDGEFHSARRQLDRLGEEGVEVRKVGARPVETLAGRLAAEVDGRTALVVVSSVLFETAEILPSLEAVAEACQREGVELLVDAYHHLNVVPFDIGGMGLVDAWVVGGGYKYCQHGEGSCFLRLPPHAELFRPVVTGWFAEFGELATDRVPGEVRYATGASRFAGATYDPTAHYRAAAVFGFFEELRLDAAALRATSLRQVGLLARLCAERGVLDRLEPAVPFDQLHRVGGFLALRAHDAPGLSTALRERGLLTDARGDLLRLGPAPYLTDDQLEAAVGVLAEVVTG